MLPELNMSQTINPLSCTVSIHSGTHENLLYDKDPHVFKQFSFPRSASWEMSADRLTDNKSTKSDGASWLTRGTEFLPLSHVRPVKTAWCGGRCIPLTLSLQQAFIYFRTQLQYPHHTHNHTQDSCRLCFPRHPDRLCPVSAPEFSLGFSNQRCNDRTNRVYQRVTQKGLDFGRLLQKCVIYSVNENPNSSSAKKSKLVIHCLIGPHLHHRSEWITWKWLRCNRDSLYFIL